eukprot:CAMPEP_0184514370 /NCGR_PEP_ID=MMETSP0198_2-20121128/3928_1 /TAXON_ID=1112570 /ORGANISM="Thraustochytrium sp., Strain LLF1b" /LENGTH=239 /DNA_ID=CAMNT_0026904557 /DNA_START=135 /DNA_END=854 /DNA_ORIENTATION=-
MPLPDPPGTKSFGEGLTPKDWWKCMKEGTKVYKQTFQDPAAAGKFVDMVATKKREEEFEIAWKETERKERLRIADGGKSVEQDVEDTLKAIEKMGLDRETARKHLGTAKEASHKGLIAFKDALLEFTRGYKEGQKEEEDRINRGENVLQKIRQNISKESPELGEMLDNASNQLSSARDTGLSIVREVQEEISKPLEPTPSDNAAKSSEKPSNDSGNRTPDVTKEPQPSSLSTIKPSKDL